VQLIKRHHFLTYQVQIQLKRHTNRQPDLAPTTPIVRLSPIRHNRERLDVFDGAYSVGKSTSDEQLREVLDGFMGFRFEKLAGGGEDSGVEDC
jgi:hypothetical protein